jgi:hypothetical protein
LPGATISVHDPVPGRIGYFVDRRGCAHKEATGLLAKSAQDTKNR